MQPIPMRRITALAVSTLFTASLLGACVTQPARPAATPAATPQAAPSPAVSARPAPKPANAATPASTPTTTTPTRPPATPPTAAAPAAASPVSKPVTATGTSGAAASVAGGKPAPTAPNPTPVARRQLPSVTVVIPNRPSPGSATSSATPPVSAPAAAPKLTAPRVVPTAPSPSDDEREQLAAMPLPKLPTLVAREASPEESPDTAEVAPRGAQRVSPGTAPSVAAPGSGAAASVATVSDDAGTTAARASLKRATDRAGLDEAALSKIRAAEQQLDSGDASGAQQRLDALNREFDTAYSSVTVGRGDNLSRIAERPGVYSNAYLWPLIWNANKDSVPQPWELKRAQTLRVPKYPSLADIAEALEYARNNSLDARRPKPAAAP